MLFTIHYTHIYEDCYIYFKKKGPFPIKKEKTDKTNECEPDIRTEHS